MAKKKRISGRAIGIGAGVAVAAALGAYFLSGKRGAANRKKIKGWMQKATAEMAEKLARIEQVSEAAYRKAAREVVARYGRIKNVDRKDLAAFAAEAKRYWRMAKKQAARYAKRMQAARSKKTARKTARASARRKK